ncbi:MAG: hypothetical protein ABJA57_01630 [Ginsengibacter sp.]
MNHNKRFWFRKGIAFFLIFIGAILLFSFAIMKLWNGILVPVVHVSAVTYGQALGIFILSKILFGGFRGGWGGRRGYGMRGMQQKFANMTPEEREKFRSEWRSRCSNWRGNRPPAADPVS